LWAGSEVVCRVTRADMLTRKETAGWDRRAGVGSRRSRLDAAPQAERERRVARERRQGHERRAQPRSGVGPVTTLRSRLMYVTVAWGLGAVLLWFITLDEWSMASGASIAAEHMRVQGLTLLVIWGMAFFLLVYAVNVVSGAG